MPQEKLEGRPVLVQLGVSLFIAVLALAFILTSGPERGVLFWVMVVILVVNAGEITWLVLKYQRHVRSRERVN